MTIEKVGRWIGEKHLAWLEYDADEFLDAFWGARLGTIAAIPAIELGETCYLELTFLNLENKTNISRLWNSLACIAWIKTNP
jgi:hypothetical protein